MALKIPYDKATKCTGKAAPGTKALHDSILANWKDSYSLGLYNCRSTRKNKNTRSLHSEGRAMDISFRKNVSERCKDLAEWASKPEIATAYQIQEVIDYQRNRSWHGTVGAWKPYKGDGYKHVHIAQNWQGANNGIPMPAVDTSVSTIASDDDDIDPNIDSANDTPFVLATLFVGLVAVGFFSIEIFS
ncbi:MAG: hypothetical protein JNL36_07705 [Candidatus Kapabacteria bacterium]|nr:hypothetical protein [Candidatus Kapabacteria bacterium]